MNNDRSTVADRDRLEDDRNALDRLGPQIDRLTAPQVVELVERYQSTSTDLAAARSAAVDPELVRRLTASVGEVHGRLYGRAARRRGGLARFAVETFPAAVWWHRRFIFVSAMCLLVPAFAVGAWMAVSSDAVEASAPASVRAAYLDTEFEAYYSSDPAAQFATEVFINNIQVAILAFAVGIALALPTVYVLFTNGALIGMAGGLFTAAGRWQQFWGLITPHGLLELAAIVVAGAAGLALGWSIVAPGDRSRATALAEAGKRSVAVILGLIVAFLVAGLIEGFVTGTDLPTWLRIGIGATAFAAFTGWVLAFGPRAARAGLTGVMGEDVGRRPSFG